MRDHIQQYLATHRLLSPRRSHHLGTGANEDPADCLDQFQSTVMQAVHLTKAVIPAMQQAGYTHCRLSTECDAKMGQSICLRCR